MLNQLKKKDKVSPDIVNNYKLKCLVLIKHKEKLLEKLEKRIGEIDSVGETVKEAVMTNINLEVEYPEFIL